MRRGVRVEVRVEVRVGAGVRVRVRAWATARVRVRGRGRVRCPSTCDGLRPERATTTRTPPSGSSSATWLGVWTRVRVRVVGRG